MYIFLQIYTCLYHAQNYVGLKWCLLGSGIKRRGTFTLLLCILVYFLIVCNVHIYNKEKTIHTHTAFEFQKKI